MSIVFDAAINQRFRDLHAQRSRSMRPNHGGIARDLLNRPTRISPTTFADATQIQLPAKPKKQPRSHSRMVANGMLASAILLVGFGAWTSWSSFTTNQAAKSQIKKLSAVTSKSTAATGLTGNADNPPDEKPLPSNALANYVVAPDLPRQLLIPEIGVKARIKPVGVDNNNQLITPTSIYDTGWYESSAKPGTHGAMLIDGHVTGYSRNGVFYNLNKLRPGSIIKVERGDGVVVSFQVVSSKSFKVDETDMKSALAPADPNHQGLNLITCTGQYSNKTHSYPDRLIVYAVATQ